MTVTDLHGKEIKMIYCKEILTGKIIQVRKEDGDNVDALATALADGLTCKNKAQGRNFIESELEIGIDTQDSIDAQRLVTALSVDIAFGMFEDRFTTQEWDDATDYVYENDTTTGNPKRRALVQGLARAMSRGVVDLKHAKTIAFMDALVAGAIITQARMNIILTP